ncbi:MAG: FAD-dependent monooxygenase, partial [Litorivicinaceae bacterium]
MTKYQTDVAILGGGPSGLMLSRLLFLDGIRSVIIERQPMQHVLERIRAGVLEEGSVNLMQEAELGDRVLREGQRHSGFRITYGDDELRIDIEKLTGKQVT